jgi:hypothetical protein
MMNHGSYDTRFDILISPGNFDLNNASGPNFEYEDVGAYELQFTGPNVPDTFGERDEFTFTAEVGEYNADQCLFFLNPISTAIR